MAHHHQRSKYLTVIVFPNSNCHIITKGNFIPKFQNLIETASVDHFRPKKMSRHMEVGEYVNHEILLNYCYDT